MAAPIRREYSRKKIVKFTIFSYIVTLIFSVILPLSIRTHIAEARWIPSGAMEPTLNGTPNQWEADKVIVDKFSYKFNNPKRGDIVVFSPTETLREEQFEDAFIKRIVGLPGEKVELKQGKVYINDKPLEENYVASGQLTSTEVCTSAPIQPYLSSSVTIPPNSYLVLGDNRGSSYDSRCWGVVPKDNIIGKASAIFWPIERRRSL
ncbi:MAG: signal peptidase I [Rivularia sp. (in: cyanobacteria)]